MNIQELRKIRLGLRSSQYLTARLAKMSRNRLSLIECGYALATKNELKNLEKALDCIEGHSKATKISKTSWGFNPGNLLNSESDK